MGLSDGAFVGPFRMSSKIVVRQFIRGLSGRFSMAFCLGCAAVGPGWFSCVLLGTVAGRFAARLGGLWLRVASSFLEKFGYVAHFW